MLQAAAVAGRQRSGCQRFARGRARPAWPAVCDLGALLLTASSATGWLHHRGWSTFLLPSWGARGPALLCPAPCRARLVTNVLMLCSAGNTREWQPLHIVCGGSCCGELVHLCIDRKPMSCMSALHVVQPFPDFVGRWSRGQPQCPVWRTPDDSRHAQMRSLHALAPSDPQLLPGAYAPARPQDLLATPFDLRPGAPAVAQDGSSLTTVRCTVQTCSADSGCSICRSGAAQPAGRNESNVLLVLAHRVCLSVSSLS
jgi:hypothetical protein